MSLGQGVIASLVANPRFLELQTLKSLFYQANWVDSRDKITYARIKKSRKEYFFRLDCPYITKSVAKIYVEEKSKNCRRI